MKIKDIQNQINKIDLYLLDQILKGRYLEGEKILDAGCGTGRNIELFLKNDFKVYGVDRNPEVIDLLNKTNLVTIDNKFKVAELDKLPFEDGFFDHIICNAVLHFAEDTNHFFQMFQELLRVLKTKGSMFIRMTSVFGIEGRVQLLNNGVYKIPDGTNRFLLDNTILEKINTEFKVEFIEPLKTVNVNNKRCMSNLMLFKR